MTSKARTVPLPGPPFPGRDTDRSGLAYVVSMVDDRGHGITDEGREQ